MRHIAAIFLLFLGISLLRADPPDYRFSSVRITSHGVTGTVIYTEKDHSIVLTAGHGFHDENGRPINKAIVIDVPELDGRRLPNAVGHPRLIRAVLEGFNDFALIDFPCGPLPSVPLAPSGYRPGRHFLSVGYDTMKWREGPKMEPAHIRGFGFDATYTDETPIPGRSGGALIDLDNGCLMGTVIGFETRPGGPGIYSRTANLQAFVAQYLQSPPSPKASPPQAVNPRTYSEPRVNNPPATNPPTGWTYDPKTGGWFRQVPEEELKYVGKPPLRVIEGPVQQSLPSPQPQIMQQFGQPPQQQCPS